MIDYDAVVGSATISDFVCVRRALWKTKLTLRDIIQHRLYEKLAEGKVMHSITRLKDDCEYEVKGEICGRRIIADAICEDKKGKYIAEMKTVLGQDNPEALFQLKTYMTAFRIPRGVLLGILDRRVKWIYFDDFENHEKDVCERIRLFNEGKDIPIKGEWCNRCMFRMQCDAVWYF